MIFSIVICLGCTSDISNIWISMPVLILSELLEGQASWGLQTSLSPHLFHLEDVYSSILRPCCWSTCPYSIYSDQCVLSAWLISIPLHTYFLVVTGSIMMQVYENQQVYKLPVPAMLIITLNEFHLHEVNDFLFFAGFVNSLFRWEWTSSGCLIHSTTCPI